MKLRGYGPSCAAFPGSLPVENFGRAPYTTGVGFGIPLCVSCGCASPREENAGESKVGQPNPNQHVLNAIRTDREELLRLFEDRLLGVESRLVLQMTEQVRRFEELVCSKGVEEKKQVYSDPLLHSKKVRYCCCNPLNIPEGIPSPLASHGVSHGLSQSSAGEPAGKLLRERKDIAGTFATPSPKAQTTRIPTIWQEADEEEKQHTPRFQDSPRTRPDVEHLRSGFEDEIDRVPLTGKRAKKGIAVDFTRSTNFESDLADRRSARTSASAGTGTASTTYQGLTASVDISSQRRSPPMTMKSGCADQKVRQRYMTLHAGTPIDNEDDTSCFRKWVHSSQFNLIIGMVTMSYALFTGWDCQVVMEHTKIKLQAASGASTAFLSSAAGANREIDKAFCFIFFAEIAVRVLADRQNFLKGPEWMWNLLDTSLAAACVAHAYLEGQPLNLNAARIVRALRMFKVLQIFRMFRFFCGLRMMIMSILNSMHSLVGLTVILVLLVYTFSVGLMQGVSGYLEQSGHLAVDPPMDTLLVMYGNIGSSMLVLLQCITGGVDWNQAMEPVLKASPIHGVIFIIYIVFAVFCLLNVVTGVFVDRALQVAQIDRDLLVVEEILKQKEFTTAVTEILNSVDEGGNGKLTRSQFQAVLEDEWVKSFFITLGLDFKDTEQLFALLDPDGDNEDISIQDFVQSSLRLKGQARSIDVCAVLFESKRISKKMSAFISFSQEMLYRIHEQIVSDDAGVVETVSQRMAHTSSNNEISVPDMRLESVLKRKMSQIRNSGTSMKTSARTMKVAGVLNP